MYTVHNLLEVDKIGGILQFKTQYKCIIALKIGRVVKSLYSILQNNQILVICSNP